MHIQIDTCNQRRRALLRAGFLVAMATLVAPASFANCGTVDVTNHFRIQAGADILSRDGWMTQSVSVLNHGEPLRGSIYLAVSNVPAGVQPSPYPLNAPRS